MSLARPFPLLTLALALSLGLAACGGGGGGDTEEGGGEGTAGGEVPEQYAGPIGSDDAAGGATIFEQACNSCHGGGAPALADIALRGQEERAVLRGQPPDVGAELGVLALE